MSAAILWVFIVTFPVLLGGPVIVPIASVSQEQCLRVRKPMASQLESHKSNAAIGACVRATLLVEEVKR